MPEKLLNPAAPSIGFLAADWIETYCTQGPGDHEDEMFNLTVDQLKFLLDVYELDTDGRRRYRRAALVRGKGHGKSTLAAAIALFEALGPARFASWGEDGQPVGKQVRNPQIRCLATAEDQASNVYDAVLHMLQQGPLADRNIDSGMTRIILPDGGTIKPVTSSALARDGGRETFVIADETHGWILPELHRLHQTMVRNLAKRHQSQAWMLETTTAFRPGEGSVAENTMAYGMKIAAGEAMDWHMLYDHRMVPLGKYDLDDPEQRMAALLESYGDAADHVDLEQASRLWVDPQTDPVDWKRYWLSQIVVAADSFLDPKEWADCTDATKSLADGDTICLGMDTSLVDDGTAVVACRVSDGYVERLGYWQKPAGRSGIGWSVPYDDVASAVEMAFARFRVLRLYADPQYIHSHLDKWSLQYGSDKIYSWSTNRPVAMASALQRLYVAVATREIVHNGDTLLAEHAGNARTFMAAGRTLIRKEAHRSPRKIDLLIAATLAFESAADAHAAGEDVEVIPASHRVWSY